jgi:hypothetical protein
MEMLIRPAQQGSQRRTWTDVPDASPLVDAWEKRNNIPVPSDYRQFITKYNGGRVYPPMFRYTVPLDKYPSTEPVTYLDPLYDWDYVEEIWNGGVFNGRNPPQMLMIGSDPGGLEVLLSLRKEDYGKIYTWLHSLSGWGEEDNDTVYLQASSFREFMDSLYDNEAREGYTYWHRPGLAHLERKLEF